MLRPVVTVSIPGSLPTMEPSWALVDTGAENVLAAAWIADLAGIDLSASTDRVLIGIGGQVAEVTFAEVELRVHAPDDAKALISWRADVGFVPGWQAPFPSSSASSASSIASRSPSIEEPRRSSSRTGTSSTPASGPALHVDDAWRGGLSYFGVARVWHAGRFGGGSSDIVPGQRPKSHTGALLRDAEVPGSNPGTPTTYVQVRGGFWRRATHR